MGSPTTVTISSPAVKRQIVRAPAALLALSMVAGIVLGRYLALPTGVWIVVGILGFLAGGAMFLRPHLHLATCIAVGVAVLCGSASYTRWCYFSIGDNDVVTFTGDSPALATLRGTIITSPQVVPADPYRHLPITPPDHTRFLLKASAIQTSAGERPAQGLVRVTISEPTQRFRPGQYVEVTCRIGRYRAADNPGQSDPAAASRQSHVLTWAVVPVAEGVTVVAGQHQSALLRVYWSVRSTLHRLLNSDTDAPITGYLMDPLATDEEAASLESLDRAMLQAGVAQYVSLSGLHLGVFLGLAFLFFRINGLTLRTGAIGVLILLVLYTALAEPNPLLLRSAILAGSLCLAAIFCRSNFALNAICVAAVLQLLVDPLDLFRAGFQLSFSICIGMIVLTGRFRDLLVVGCLRRRSPMNLDDGQQKEPSHCGIALSWLATALAASLAAYVVSVPLVAYHFGFFSPYAWPLSILMAAPVAMVLLPKCMSIMLLWAIPSLSAAYDRLACDAAETLTGLANWAHHLPGLSIPMRPVGPVWVVACYATIALMFGWRKVPFGRPAAAAAAAIVLGLTVHTQLPAPVPPSGEIHLLSVGVGQCAVLRTPSDQTYILDAGTRNAVDAWWTVLKPFLREGGLPMPSAAIISHANSDHYNAIPELLRASPLQAVYVNDCFPTGKGDRSDPAMQYLLRASAAAKVPFRILIAGDELNLDERTKVQVLWPLAPDRRNFRASSSNDTCLVLRVVCDGKSILLPGDISPKGQAGLLASAGEKLRSDVLVLPDHGTWTKDLVTLVDRVQPKVVIASSSHDPGGFDDSKMAAEYFGHLRQSMEFYSTWKNGCISVRLCPTGVQVTPNTVSANARTDADGRFR